MSDFSFVLNNIEIKGKGLYQIVPKPDLDAPDGFVKFETSKLLMNGIGETAPCRFDEKKKVWDTGFYIDSPCYMGNKDEKTVTLINTLQEHIVKPYEETHGAGCLDYKKTNNEFWDTFGGKLYNGRVLNTANTEDLLELYMAIRQGALVRPEDKSKPFASAAKYCIINKEAAISLKEQKQKQKANAIGGFVSMLGSDKDGLLNIMEYLGIISTREKDAEVITSLMMEFLEDDKTGSNNIKRFIESKTQYNFPKGKQEYETFAHLRELRRKRIITEEYGSLYLNGIELGANLKDATARVNKDKDLQIKVAEALENETA